MKAQADQAALRKAVASGSPKFFLGTDSAPHATLTKESSCGCAGCYSAPIALPLYATIFEELDILDKLEAFASLHGPRFYGLEVSEERVVLEREPLTVPDRLDYISEDGVVPLGAGMTLPVANEARPLSQNTSISSIALEFSVPSAMLRATPRSVDEVIPLPFLLRR